jgi:Delta3-Delta2-enoyl-CoA isomerase
MILTFDHGAIRELRLNRPPANALSPELILALRRAVESAPHDGVRALVLSGAPGRFCAGLDVPLLLTFDRPAMASLWRELYALMRALACSPIPIAAALTGHAPAGGTVLPLFCDWRVIAEGDFKMGLNEVQVGIPLPPAILAALRRLVGRAARRRWIDHLGRPSGQHGSGRRNGSSRAGRRPRGSMVFEPACASSHCNGLHPPPSAS